MLTIRGNQIEIFKDIAKNEFIERIFNIMAASFPEECRRMGRARAMNRIRGGIKQAGRLGISESANLVRYVNLLFLFATDELGRDQKTAWAENILAWEGADENLILAALEKRGKQVLAEGYR